MGLERKDQNFDLGWKGQSGGFGRRCPAVILNWGGSYQFLPGLSHRQSEEVEGRPRPALVEEERWLLTASDGGVGRRGFCCWDGF